MEVHLNCPHCGKAVKVTTLVELQQGSRGATEEPSERNTGNSGTSIPGFHASHLFERGRCGLCWCWAVQDIAKLPCPNGDVGAADERDEGVERLCVVCGASSLSSELTARCPKSVAIEGHRWGRVVNPHRQGKGLHPSHEWEWFRHGSGVCYHCGLSNTSPQALRHCVAKTEPCCNCGEEYPRIDLTRDGHVYCAKCRFSEMHESHQWTDSKQPLEACKRCGCNQLSTPSYRPCGKA